MTPLGILTLGLTFVVIDLRFGEVDVVPDLLGWVLCAVALGRLSPAVKQWRQARQVSIVAAGMQVLLLFGAIGQVRLGPEASSVFSVIELGLGTAMVSAICTAFIEVLPETKLLPDVKPTGTLREAFLIRAIYLALAGIVIMLIILAVMTDTVFAAGGLLFILIPLFGTFVWFITLVYRLRAHPRLQAA